SRSTKDRQVGDLMRQQMLVKDGSLWVITSSRATDIMGGENFWFRLITPPRFRSARVFQYFFELWPDIVEYFPIVLYDVISHTDDRYAVVITFVGIEIKVVVLVGQDLKFMTY